MSKIESEDLFSIKSGQNSALLKRIQSLRLEDRRICHISSNSFLDLFLEACEKLAKTLIGFISFSLQLEIAKRGKLEALRDKFLLQNQAKCKKHFEKLFI